MNRLLDTALYYPKISQGHGSLRNHTCNRPGCNPAKSDRHFQDRYQLAQDYWRSVKLDRNNPRS